MKEIRQVPKIAWTKMDDSIVILDTRGERHFHELNPVAAFLWEQIETPKSFDSLVEMITTEFEVSKEMATDDLCQILETLKEKELVSYS